MKLTFKRKNNAITGKGNSIWQKFEQANCRLQHTCAKWLERKTSHFSRLNWIVVLFIFIFFTGGCSIYLIVKSFSGSTTESVTIIPFTKPTSSVDLKETSIGIKTIISKAELERVAHFRRYMDSLGRSPTGKKTHDSIVFKRPGLLDSLTMLENYYYSHLKN